MAAYQTITDSGQLVKAVSAIESGDEMAIRNSQWQVGQDTQSLAQFLLTIFASIERWQLHQLVSTWSRIDHPVLGTLEWQLELGKYNRRLALRTNGELRLEVITGVSGPRVTWNAPGTKELSNLGRLSIIGSL